jgi:hypothetical protein
MKAIFLFIILVFIVCLPNKGTLTFVEYVSPINGKQRFLLIRENKRSKKFMIID